MIAEGLVRHFGNCVVVCSPFSERYGDARYVRSVQLNGTSLTPLHNIIASTACYAFHPSVVYSHYYGRMRTKSPQVFMVHDMMHELFPHYFPTNTPYNKRFVEEKKSCIERGAVLLATSINTARDIVSLYPDISGEKIVVAYQGVDDFFFDADNVCQRAAGKPFFLYVGHRTVYKNFYRLLVAFGQSGLVDDFDLRVISPALTAFTHDEKEVIRRYHLKNSVHLLSSAGDDLLRESYAQAAAYVYPSEYEGFGLTVLEAMASGTLVAAARIASLPEVGGEAAFYFDPYDTEAIAACLCEIAALPAERRLARIAQGRAHARTFTWDRCVDQFASVLRRFM